MGDIYIDAPPTEQKFPRPDDGGPGGPDTEYGDGNGEYYPGPGMGGGEGPSTAPEQIIIDESFKNNECIMGVYTKLGGTQFAKKHLTKFDTKLKRPNLTWKVDSIPATEEGIIHGIAIPEDGERDAFIITINDQASKYDLEIAATMIHEIMHATFMRLYGEQVSMSGFEKNLPTLFNYFNKYGYYGLIHPIMADHYINTMITALQEFDNSHPDEYYEALSWDGLQTTDAYKKLSPEKKEYLKKSRQNFYNDAKKKECN